MIHDHDSLGDLSFTLPLNPGPNRVIPMPYTHPGRKVELDLTPKSQKPGRKTRMIRPVWKLKLPESNPWF